ncbi:MAG: YebC/PmpR family DNA-binding transcriptional regulator [Patescibacteria group bacterium]
MSGHSKWSNIKDRKGAQDKKRGAVFGHLSKLITMAVKEGGSSDPTQNPRLRTIIDQARSEDMPKDNIQRAIDNAQKRGDLEEFIVEGYGPGGAAVLVKVATDNRQRTIQELKSVFQRAGGSVVKPGAASYQFNDDLTVKIKISLDADNKSRLDSFVADLDEHEDVVGVFVNA